MAIDFWAMLNSLSYWNSSVHRDTAACVQVKLYRDGFIL